MHTIFTKETGQETQRLNMAEQLSSYKRMLRYDTRATRIQEDWEYGWNRHSKAKTRTSSRLSVVTNQINQRQHNHTQSFGNHCDRFNHQPDPNLMAAEKP
jgi:hypothetical protein